MKIFLSVMNSSLYTAGSNQMLSLARYLIAHGHKVSCVYRYGKDRYANMINQFEEFSLNRFDYNKSYNKSFHDFLLKNQFDILHAHASMGSFLIKHISDGYSGKIGLHFGFTPNDNNVLHLCRNPLINFVTCVSNSITQKIKKVLENNSNNRVVTVYSGTDFSKFKPMHKSHTILREFDLFDSFVVGFLAHIRPYKRLDIFLQTANIISKSYDDVKFLIVGKINDEYIEMASSVLNKLPQKNNKSYYFDNVIFTDIRKDIPSILSTFDLSVNCSDRYEGIVGAMRESLAMEIPVICTNVGGNSEIIINEETGYLIPPGDPNLLAQKIESIINNYDHAKRLAKKGRIMIRSLSDQNRNKTMLELYKKQIL